MKKMAAIPTFKRSWEIFGPEIVKLLGSNPTALDILDIGDNLSAIFQSNAGGRSQSDVSAGGTVWECLVAWYLNLVMYGTDVVALRPTADFLPPSISNATAVTIFNTRTNTETDLVCVRAPSLSKGENYNYVTLEEAISSNPKSVDVTIVQCKTNWNDNAQIPMLWGIIYASSGGVSVANVNVGIGGYTPSSFGSFKYAFVTVPTSRGPFRATSLPVLRVSALSGGNYWGKSSQNRVANSLKEFFTTNFSTAFSVHGSVASSIQNNLIASPNKVLDKFIDLDFDLSTGLFEP